MYLVMKITRHLRRSTADSGLLGRSQRLTYVIRQEIVPVIGIGITCMRKARRRNGCVVNPTDRTLYPKENVIITYEYRYLWQVVNLRFAKILR